MAYYQIDNKIYYLNLDNLFKMVIETPSNEKPVNTTITQSYGGECDNGKEIVESKNNLNEVMIFTNFNPWMISLDSKS